MFRHDIVNSHLRIIISKWQICILTNFITFLQTSSSFKHRAFLKIVGVIEPPFQIRFPIR